MDQKQTNQTTLEQAMRELERIVGEIEAGRLPLEQGLEKYERGNQLIEHCRRILAKAEEQIAGPAAREEHPGEQATSDANRQDLSQTVNDRGQDL